MCRLGLARPLPPARSKIKYKGCFISGGARLAREQARVDAFGLEARLPAVVDRRVEQDRLAAGGGEPAVARHFLVELALAPSGIAKRDEVAAWSPALGDGAQHVDRPGQRTEAGHRDRILTAPIVAVE